MLGINERIEPVKPPFALQMRESLRRANTGQLNDSEKAIIEKEAALSSQFSSVWV